VPGSLGRVGPDRRLTPDWFAGRDPKCTLLVFVNDATSRLMYLQFVAAETTFNYFAGVRSYNVIYQIKTKRSAYTLLQAHVEVR
jgi:hypothetical protein